MKKSKIILPSLIFLSSLALLIGGFFLVKSTTNPPANSDQSTHQITAADFISYDLLRTLTKDLPSINLHLLLPAGADLHSFEPTPSDLVKLKSSHTFVYLGNTSGHWTEKIKGTLNGQATNSIKLLSALVDDDHDDRHDKHDDRHDKHDHNHDKHNHSHDNHSHDHDNHDHSHDDHEHPWTNPKNMIRLTRYLTEKLNEPNSKLSPYSTLIKTNSDDFIKKLEGLDDAFRQVVKTSKRKTLIFGDRFPFAAFTSEYDLKAHSAFPGCSHQTEASTATVTNLINLVKSEKIPVVLHLELSDTKLAKTIATATNAKLLEFHSVHNLSKTDFDNHLTYLDLMNRNLEVLKEALN